MGNYFQCCLSKLVRVGHGCEGRPRKVRKLGPLQARGLGLAGIWGYAGPLIADASKTPFASSRAKRLGLEEPACSNLKLLGIAFTVYHALKVSNMNLISDAIASDCFDEVLVKARAIAIVAARTFVLRPL